EGIVRENAARLVATPKLPKRVPSILSAEEMNEFLDGLAQVQRPKAKRPSARASQVAQDAALLLQRDRAILELLYASGLRVSELTGLNVEDVDRRERMLRVIGKGNKERIIPYGSKAGGAVERYWPIPCKVLTRSHHRG